MLEIDKITLRYPEMQTAALRAVSLQLAPGEFTCIIGPSGSGKTSFLRVLAGLQQPNSGKVIMDGKDITAMPAEKRDIVMVFQQDLLFPFLSVQQNIAFGLKLRSMKQQEIDTLVQSMLDLIQLPGMEGRMPHQLSAGQRQRVSLARSLVLKPRILLLDEPFSNMDPDLQQDMRELLLAIRRSFSVSIICVTHSPEDVLLLADTIGFMSDGILLQHGDERELFEHPRSVEIAQFFGNSNFLPASWEDGGTKCCGVRIPFTPESHLRHGEKNFLLTCRPEYAKLSPRKTRQKKQRGALLRYNTKRGLILYAVLRQCAYSPAGMRYRLSVGSAIWNVLEQTGNGKTTSYAPGEEVEIEIPDSCVCFLPAEQYQMRKQFYGLKHSPYHGIIADEYE